MLILLTDTFVPVSLDTQECTAKRVRASVSFPSLLSFFLSFFLLTFFFLSLFSSSEIRHSSHPQKKSIILNSTSFKTDMDECSSNPCFNGGTCVDQVNGYVCNCQSGYGGTRCQTSEHFAYFDVIQLVHLNYYFFYLRSKRRFLRIYKITRY